MDCFQVGDPCSWQPLLFVSCKSSLSLRIHDDHLAEVHAWIELLLLLLLFFKDRKLPIGHQEPRKLQRVKVWCKCSILYIPFRVVFGDLMFHTFLPAVGPAGLMKVVGV